MFFWVRNDCPSSPNVYRKPDKWVSSSLGHVAFSFKKKLSLIDTALPRLAAADLICSFKHRLKILFLLQLEHYHLDYNTKGAFLSSESTHFKHFNWQRFSICIIFSCLCIFHHWQMISLYEKISAVTSRKGFTFHITGNFRKKNWCWLEVA